MAGFAERLRSTLGPDDIAARFAEHQFAVLSRNSDHRHTTGLAEHVRTAFADHVLTIGANARITAQVVAKAIVVFGHVRGNLNAAEKVDIRDSGSVEGDVVSPRVAIADGAHFRGSVDMQRKEQAAAKPPAAAASRSEAKAAAPAPVVPATAGQLASA